MSPQVVPDVAMLARFKDRVKSVVSQWHDILVANQLNYGYFTMFPENSTLELCFFVGIMAQEWESLGYTIVSHSSSVVGQKQTPEGSVPVVYVSFLVKATGPTKPLLHLAH